MESAKVSVKNQVVIPKKIREAIRIKPGDELLFEAGKCTITIVPRPKDYVESMRGLGKEIWEGIDAQDYLRKEREEW